MVAGISVGVVVVGSSWVEVLGGGAEDLSAICAYAGHGGRHY